MPLCSSYAGLPLVLEVVVIEPGYVKRCEAGVVDYLVDGDAISLRFLKLYAQRPDYAPG